MKDATLAVPMVRPPNAYELLARDKKAHAIARWMYAKMLEIAESADDEMWANTAAKAGQNPPSAETKARVIEILKGRKP